MMKKISLFLSLSIFLFGCGYTQQAILPNDIKSIAVPTFQNQLAFSTTYTYEAGIEILVTEAIIERLNYDGNLKVLPQAEADATLVGKVVAYEQDAVRFEDRTEVKEYQMFLSCDLALVDNRTGETIWDEKGFTGRTDFFRTGGRAITERAALIEATKDLSHKVIDRIVEGW